MSEQRTRYIPPEDRDTKTTDTVQPAMTFTSEDAPQEPEVTPEAPAAPEPPENLEEKPSEGPAQMVFETVEEEEPPKKHKGIKAVLITLIVLVILAGLALVAYKKGPYLLDRFGIAQEDVAYQLVIQKGDYEYKATDTLQQEGIIKSGEAFRNYIASHDPDFTYTPGEYDLNANMSFAQLLNALNNPTVTYEYVSVVVAEGKSIWKVAALMEENGVCSSEDFLNAANDYDYDYEFLRTVEQEDDSLVCYKLEGFLFPATYEFRVGMDARDVVDTMLQAFANYLPDEIYTVCEEKGVTLRQMITLASIIQAESFGTEMMENVSSVFWNRLASSTYPNLQSNPTKTYANAIADEVEDATDEMIAAYDTYQAEGIPAGAINNPGLDAIKAAMYPADTDYYYFVTGEDNDVYYSKTLSQHYAYCRALGLM